MTKFDDSGTAEQWLGILKEELPKDLTPSTWRKNVSTRLDRYIVAWVDKTPKIKQIL